MKTHLLPYYKSLRSKVIEKFNGGEVQSSDCYLLSKEINRSTLKSISETTLKRFFGHTSSTHNPSKYTLNALSLYIGCLSWSEFVEQEDRETYSSGEHKLWCEMKSYTDKITHFNIFSFERKITHNRDNIIERTHLSPILLSNNSENTLTLVHGPEKCGKTTAIIHAVKSELQNESDDIILYVDSMTLFHSAVYGFNPNKWFSTMLDFENDTKTEQFFEFYKDNCPGKFRIIIDGFNEELLNENLFNAVISNFVDVITYFSSYSWLKFTLITKSNIFLKIKESVGQNSNILFKYKLIDFQSDHFFESIDIHRIMDLEKIEHTIDEVTSHFFENWLRNPYYLASYIEMYQSNNRLDFRKKECWFMSLHNFHWKHINFLEILKKDDDDEILEFLKNIACIHGTSNPNNSKNYFSLKNNRNFNSIIFDKLIGNGILIKKSDDDFSGYVYAFPLLKSYLLSIYGYYSLKKKDLETFNTFINTNISSPRLLRESLHWFYLFSVENLDFSIFEDCAFDFVKNVDKNNAMYWMSIFIQNTYHQSNKITKKEIVNRLIAGKINHSLIYNGLLPYSNLKHCYELLLTIELPKCTEFQIRSNLSLAALKNWDEVELIKQLDFLSKLTQEDSSFNSSINVVTTLSAIYHFLKHGTVHEHLIRTALNASQGHLSSEQSMDEQLVTLDLLSYILILISKDTNYANIFYNKLKNKKSKLLKENVKTQVFYAYLLKLMEVRLGISKRTKTKSKTNANSEIEGYTDYISILTELLNLHLQRNLSTPDLNRLNIKELEVRNTLKKLGYDKFANYFTEMGQFLLVENNHVSHIHLD